MPDAPLRPAFAALPWRSSKRDLRAWQHGETGIPIVDAGMRQLWQTGWMHNRVRMIVASFLVKHLLIDWRAGEAWFWDTLVDADLANNATNWQWVAGSGIDAQPFFRIFNPVTQGQKFDAAGAYVRRFVPELAKLPDAHLHAPWQAPDDDSARGRRHAGKDLSAPDRRSRRGTAARARPPIARRSAADLIPNGAAIRVVGDVHGEARAFAYAAATDRFVVQLGDLTDRGPDSAGALRIMLDLLDRRRGLFVLGNHDHKLARALLGHNVRIDAALAAHARRARPRSARPQPRRDRERAGLAPPRRPLLRPWRLPHRHARDTRRPAASPRPDGVLSRALYGQTTGRRQADGYPERVLDWVDRIPRGLTVYCGHDVRSTDGRPWRKQGALGGTAVFVDTGASKGGHLSWIDI